jgi:glycosyltransferase involved in cell wall biosynthesis
MRIGETGRIVRCDVPDQLAATVVEFLSDKERMGQMGAAARTWVERRFDWSALSRQAERVFSELGPLEAAEPAVTPRPEISSPLLLAER